MTISRPLLALLLCIATGVVACVKKGQLTKTQGVDAAHFMLAGHVAAPKPMDQTTVLAGSSITAGQNWYLCPASGNKTAIGKDGYTVDAKSNCSGTQFIDFYFSKGQDVTHYLPGSMEIDLLVNSGTMDLNLSVEDTNSIESTKVDLAKYGFSSSQTTTVQKVVVPLADLKAGAATDFSSLAQVVRLTINCNAGECLFLIKKVKYQVKSSMPPGGSGGGTSRSYCAKVPCQAITAAPVNLIVPSAAGWKIVSTADTLATDDTGYYEVVFDMSVLVTYTETDVPMYVATTDDDGDTLLSPVQTSAVDGGAIVDDNVDLTSTLTSRMHCPGGVFPAPSGGYCSQDLDEEQSASGLDAQIDGYLSANVDVLDGDVDDQLGAVLGDATVYASFSAEVQASGTTSVAAAASIAATASAAPLPEVTFPTTTAGDGGTGSSTGSGTGGLSCGGTTQCNAQAIGNCSVQACACVASDGSKAACWYVENGSTVACGPSCDCVAAATSIAQSCQ